MSSFAPRKNAPFAERKATLHADLFLTLRYFRRLGSHLLGGGLAIAIAIGRGPVAELAVDEAEPLVVGIGVGAELLELPFFFAEEEGAMLAQLAPRGRVDQG